MNVLLIEDDPALAHELAQHLRQERYICEIARTAREASEKLFVTPYDFVLLDLGLPDADGLTLLAEARQQEHQKDASVIVLSARGSVDDRINGLRLGADDYLPKPYSLLELTFRMQAITRRKHGVAQDTISFGPFQMNLADRTLRHETKVIDLTRKEFDLLYYFILHRGRVLTRGQLSEHIWGSGRYDDGYDSNFIEVHVKNLRRKLAQADPAPEWVATVRGVGYRLVEEGGKV